MEKRLIARLGLVSAAAFLCLFALSRFAIAWAGIAPNPDLIHVHWQNADLQLLKSDPFGTLWALHAQPPGWNAMLALAVAVAGSAPTAATAAVHAIYILFSAAVGLMMLAILRRLGFSHAWSVALALAALCMPAVIYYENLAFYPHLTFFLSTLLVFAILHVERGKSFAPVAAAIVLLVVLAWTWAIFHPAFVALMGALLIVWRGADRRSWASLALAVALSALPTMKNAITYGMPSASTWVGLNLAQTDSHLSTADARRCTFVHAFLDAEAAAKPLPDLHPAAGAPRKSEGDPNLNYVGMIPRSKECLGLARTDMLADPIGWLGGRAIALVRSHQSLPFNYDQDPRGWSTAFGPLEAAQEQSGAIGRTLVLVIYLGLWWWGARNTARGQQRWRHGALMLLAGYFTLASHLLNGGEQERMRYTLEPVYLLLTAEIIRTAAGRFRASRIRRSPEARIGDAVQG